MRKTTRIRARQQRRTLGAVFVALTFLVAACGGSSTSSPASGSDGGSNSSGDKSGTLIVATDPSHPPHDFKDDNGNIVGWEHEFMLAVGKQMGRPMQYKSAGFDALIPGLQSGRYDMVLANMGITPERLNAVDMVTVFSSGQAFLGQKSSGLDLTGVEDLCGLRLGTTRGSTQAELATAQSKKCVSSGKKPIDIKLFQSGDQIILAVESGRIDVYWTAQPIAAYYASQPGKKLAVVGVVPGEKSPTAIALPKGSDLTEPVHDAVQELIDDGTYEKILKEWHIEDGAIQTSHVNPKPEA